MSGSGPADGAAEEVAAVHAAYYAAFELGDLDAMSALWVGGPLAPDAWVVHPGLAVIRGRERVLRSYAAAMAAATYLQFVITDVHQHVAGELAVVGCVENVLAAEGDEAALSGGTVVATSALRRTDAGWRVLGHHGSGVLPPPDRGRPAD